MIGCGLPWSDAAPAVPNNPSAALLEIFILDPFIWDFHSGSRLRGNLSQVGNPNSISTLLSGETSRPLHLKQALAGIDPRLHDAAVSGDSILHRDHRTGRTNAISKLRTQIILKTLSRKRVQTRQQQIN